jgi:hypothetical protein
MWEYDEESGPLKSQKMATFSALSPPFKNIYIISCIWIGVYNNCFLIS